MTELERLVGQYIEVKKEEAHITKVTKDLNARIKKAMLAENLDEIEANNGIARLSTRRSESFDEENLIKFLKASGKARGLVRKREYVDYDALESAIYHGKLDDETIKNLESYKIVKESQVLTIK